MSATTIVFRSLRWARGFVLLGCLFAAACGKDNSAPSAPPPPIVRKVELQIHSSTWRTGPPLNITEEMTRKLRDEGIQVLPQGAAGRDGIVAISYEESKGFSYKPVFGSSSAGHGTHITFDMTVLDASAKTLCSISCLCSTPREVSSVDLYQGAVEEFRENPVYIHAGHFVGASLGVAGSLPKLLPATLVRNTRKEAIRILKSVAFTPSGPVQEATWAAAQEDYAKCIALGAPAVEPLLAAFRTAEGDPPTLMAIGRALGEIGDARAEEAMMEQVMRYSSESTRPEHIVLYLTLLEALGKAGDALVLSNLEAVSQSKTPEIARAAQAAAEKIRARIASKKQSSNWGFVPTATAAEPPKTQAASGAADPVVAQALEKFAASDDAGALRQIEEALRLDPSHALALGMRGVLKAAEAYYSVGNPADKDRVTRFRREFIPLWGQDLGFESLSPDEKKRCRLALKAALADVERAAERDRVDERVSLCRGLVYLWRVDTDGVENADQAIADFTRAIQLNSEMSDAYYYRAWARFKQTPVNALTKLDEWFRSSRAQPGIAPPPPVLDAEIEKTLSLYDLWMADNCKCAELKEKNPGAFRLRRPGDEGAVLGGWSIILGRVKQALAQAPRDMEDKNLFEKAREAIVRIEWREGNKIVFGTGFGIEEITGEILTNEHVVHGAPDGRVTVMKYGGDKLAGRVVAVDAKRDLAVVGVRSLGVRSLIVIPPESNEMVNSRARFGTRVTVGERVVVIGHPKGMNWSLSRGIVSAVRKVDGVQHLQTDAAVNKGNSGGPILNARGQIVGVATWGIRESEGLNFGVLSKEVFAFLEERFKQR
ncbi:MAG: trypsin-like peptidase domain-containing protein [Verrucomicrobia bacterium]|nr:trypsin-like peptidase domain-containing protein [Verrucomicrobiota bacterium]